MCFFPPRQTVLQLDTLILAVAVYGLLLDLVSMTFF